MTEYISYKQALQAMIDGNYIKHVYFSANENLYYENGIIKDEKNYNMGRSHQKFWKINMAKLPENGWYIDNN